MVVTDARLAGTPVAAAVTDRVAAPVSTVPVGEPTTASVDRLARRLSGAEVIVAVGGGSVLDSAKLAGAAAATSARASDLLAAATPIEDSVPVIAVPTTAGAGAEVTRTAVVSHHGTKAWAWHDCLRPESAVLDGDLTVGLPRTTTASSGLDAAVHAAEAATAATGDEEATRLGTTALGMIGEVLPVVVEHPTDRAARSEMLLAATIAGLAIDRAGTGLAHAVGHALGSLVAVPHGLAVALALAAAADFNADAGDPRCDAVASALSGSGYAGAIRALCDRVGLDDHLAAIATTAPVDAAELSRSTLGPLNAVMCANNVRAPSPEDVAAIASAVARRWERIGGRL